MSHYNQQGGLECQFCSKVLNKADMYRWHMRDHASLPVYKCGICCKTFSDSSNFAKHRKTHNFHSKECDVCHKKFLSDVMLAKHVELHYNKGPITCTKCNKEFFEDSAYRRHMRSAHGDKARFTCPVCKEKFDSLRLKWDHMWTAHNQRTCQADCPICRKSFRKYQDVRVHLRDVHNRKAMFLNQKLIKILPKVINDYKAGEVAGSSSQIGKVDNEMYVVYEEEEKAEAKEEQSDSD
ncbi:hypothetical protein evm_013012 [Chilo suppressalis]|nr:hypothetical protein evm_013012 [Chilo suppressalis]